MNKYICPERDCTDWGDKYKCEHGIIHDECYECHHGEPICKNCVEVKDE
jgi:hypothetical protein